MSGGWRITDEEAIADLDQAREIARATRTDDAWAVVAARVARCRRLEIPEDRLRGS